MPKIIQQWRTLSAELAKTNWTGEKLEEYDKLTIQVVAYCLKWAGKRNL